MEKRELICIGCPLGCPLTVTLEQNEVISVSGNTCPKGDAYAREEVLHPTRIVTSSVCVTGGTQAMVPCKTKAPIPKDQIFAVIDSLRSLRVEAPVTIGDILLENVAGTGVEVIATKNILQA